VQPAEANDYPVMSIHQLNTCTYQFDRLVNILLLYNSNNNTNKTACQSKADHSPTVYTDTLFCFCDVDLDPITLMYETDLKISKICPCTKNELSRSRLSKL